MGLWDYLRVNILHLIIYVVHHLTSYNRPSYIHKPLHPLTVQMCRAEQVYAVKLLTEAYFPTTFVTSYV